MCFAHILVAFSRFINSQSLFPERTETKRSNDAIYRTTTRAHKLVSGIKSNLINVRITFTSNEYSHRENQSLKFSKIQRNKSVAIFRKYERILACLSLLFAGRVCQ